MTGFAVPVPTGISVGVSWDGLLAMLESVGWRVVRAGYTTELSEIPAAEVLSLRPEELGRDISGYSASLRGVLAVLLACPEDLPLLLACPDELGFDRFERRMATDLGRARLEGRLP